MATARPMVTEPREEKIWAIKRKTKRSWIQLRRGCEDLLGQAAQHPTYMVGASSRAFAWKVADETGLTYRTILK